ncbi:MAG: hypothetical protein RLZZ440_2492 [Planctomycetota bacterium]
MPGNENRTLPKTRCRSTSPPPPAKKHSAGREFSAAQSAIQTRRQQFFPGKMRGCSRSGYPGGSNSRLTEWFRSRGRLFCTRPPLGRAALATSAPDPLEHPPKISPVLRQSPTTPRPRQVLSLDDATERVDRWLLPYTPAQGRRRWLGMRFFRWKRAAAGTAADETRGKTAKCAKDDHSGASGPTGGSPARSFARAAVRRPRVRVSEGSSPKRSA